MSLRTPHPGVAWLAALSLLVAACGGTGGPASARPSTASNPSASLACVERAAPDPASIERWSPSSQDPSVFPVIVSSSGSLACGTNRVMFSVLDASNTPVAAPDRTATIAFYDLAEDPDQAVSNTEGTFIWAIEGAVGIYVVQADFTSAGVWGAEITTAAPGSPSETVRLQFDVQLEPRVLAVGDAAPVSDTPTLATVGGDVAKLSTDDEPVERFYESSIADALAAKQPFVVVFATPKFCASAQCGPTLDRVKPIAAAHPDLTVINVEPYQLQDVEGQLQPVLSEGGGLTPAAATLEWKLLSEPWIFVVDGDGIIRASFEGIVSEAELEAAFAEVTGG